MPRPSYLGLTWSISWLLMSWLLTSPGNQQKWYWLWVKHPKTKGRASCFFWVFFNRSYSATHISSYSIGCSNSCRWQLFGLTIPLTSQNIPHRYEHGFVVFCFNVITLIFLNRIVRGRYPYSSDCSTGIWAIVWSIDYIHVKQWDVITHPCPNFNGGLVRQPLMSGHGWV